MAEENGKLIGIAPLMYSVHTMFGLQRGTIEFIGAGHPTYSNFIINDEHDKCIQKFFEYLNNLPKKWICAELCNLSQDRNSLSSLNKISNNVERERKCLLTKLPSSSDAFLSTIKRKDRKEFRRNLRRLQNDGFKVDLTDCSETNQITKGMSSLFYLNQKRWNSKGFSGKFSDPNFCNFCLDVAKCFSEKGWLGLYNLELYGKPVASLFGFKYKSTYSAYITGMDPAYKQYGVGTLLFIKVIDRCIQDGLAEFDFMWGTDHYKQQYNPVSKYTFKASVPRKGTLSHFNYLLYKKYWSHGNRLLYFHEKLLKSR
ncbi:MAG: GNAT family N-acetyltransferase [Candidatus Bathyarchaeia archaeon]